MHFVPLSSARSGCWFVCVRVIRNQVLEMPFESHECAAEVRVVSETQQYHHRWLYVINKSDFVIL